VFIVLRLYFCAFPLPVINKVSHPSMEWGTSSRSLLEVAPVATRIISCPFPFVTSPLDSWLTLPGVQSFSKPVVFVVFHMPYMSMNDLPR
jgi:hypothetical protein